MKTLTREKGMRMWGSGGSSSGSSGGGGISPSQLAGFATESWVEENFVKAEWFDQVFQIFDDDEKIEVNGELPEDTSAMNIQAMFGFWTNFYVSALGNGGQAGNAIYLSQLQDVEITGSPDGQVLKYSNGKWRNAAETAGTVTAIKVGNTTYSPSAGVVSLPAYPTVPTAVSAFTNDAGYATSTWVNSQISDMATQTWVNTQITNTKTWVSNNFVSITFFSRLFKAYNGSTQVSPNDTTTTIDNIKAMFGFWTDFYISALGNGGQAGNAIYLSQLQDVEITGSPNGQVLKYSNGKWRNAAETSGTVTAIKIGSTTYSPSAGIVTLPDYPDSSSFATQTWVHSNYLPLSGGTISGGITLSQNAGGILTADSQGIYIQKGTHWLRATANGCDCDGYAIATQTWVNTQISDMATKTWVNTQISDMATKTWTDGRYLKLAGGTMTGAIGLKSDAYYTASDYGLDCNNSDIIGVNSIYTEDTCDAWSEGIEFKRTNGNWDSFRAKDDIFYFGTNSGTERVWLNAATGSGDLGLTLQGANYTMTLCIGNGGTNRGIWGVTSNKWLLYFNASNTILNFGNVGIGTTSPSYKLHVDGVIYSTTGVYSAGYVTALSDMRCKDVVSQLLLNVEDVAEAPLFRYRLKDRENDRTVRVGSSAQYWQKLLPEAVNELQGRLTMDYGVIALAASISIASRVMNMEQRIKELEEIIKKG